MKSINLELETKVEGSDEMFLTKLEITYYRGKYVLTWPGEFAIPNASVRVVFTEYGLKHLIRMVRAAKQLRDHHRCGFELVLLPSEKPEVTEYPADSSDILPDVHDMGGLVEWIEADGGRSLMEIMRALKKRDAA